MAVAASSAYTAGAAAPRQAQVTAIESSGLGFMNGASRYGYRSANCEPRRRFAGNRCTECETAQRPADIRSWSIGGCDPVGPMADTSLSGAWHFCGASGPPAMAVTVDWR